MATDVEKLIVRLEATQNKFDKQMVAATKSAARSTGKIEGRFKKMNRNISKQMKGVAKSFAGAFAAAASVQGLKRLTGAANEAVSELSEIAKVADRIGLTTDRLQKLRVAAELYGVGQRALDKGIGTFTANLGKAAAGTGELFQILRNNNIAIRDQAGNVRKTGDVLDDYSDLINRAAEGTERFTLAYVGFGSKAAGVVNLLKGGSAELKRQEEAIARLGIVIDEKLLRHAEKLDDEFLLASKVIKTQFQRVLIKLAPHINTVAVAISELVSGLEKLNLLPSNISGNTPLDALKARAEELRAEMDGIRERVSKQGPIGRFFYGALAGNVKKRFNTAKDELDNIENNLIPQQQIAKRELEKFTRMERHLNEINRKLGGPVSLGGVGGGASSALDKTIDINTKSALDTYLRRLIGSESSGNRTAKNKDTSASGLGQFVRGTFLEQFKKVFPAVATDFARRFGKTANERIWKTFRFNNDTQIALLKNFTRENAAHLKKQGVAVTAASLHLSHFLGRFDATKVLKAPAGTPLKGLINQESIDKNPTILGGGRTVDDAINFALKKQNQVRIAAGDLTMREGQNAEIEKMLQTQRDLNAEMRLEQDLIGATAAEREKALTIFRLEQEFKEKGIPITEELRAKIVALAEAQGHLAEQTENASTSLEDQIAFADEFRSATKDILGGFIDDIRNGESAADALFNALRKIEDKLIDMALNSLIDGLFGAQGTTGGGIFGGGLGFLSSIFGGFKDGGKVQKRAHGGKIKGQGTGTSDDIPAWLSDGEYIMTAAATKLFEPQLAAMNKGIMPSFANGGRADGGASPNVSVAGASVKVVNVSRPADIMAAALADHEGQEVFINFNSENRNGMTGALGIGQ